MRTFFKVDQQTLGKESLVIVTGIFRRLCSEKQNRFSVAFIQLFSIKFVCGISYSKRNKFIWAIHNSFLNVTRFAFLQIYVQHHFSARS